MRQILTGQLGQLFGKSDGRFIKKSSLLIFRLLFVLFSCTYCEEENSFVLGPEGQRNIGSVGGQGISAGDILINNGDDYTTDKVVELSFSPGRNTDEMFVSFESDCSEGNWEAFETNKLIELKQPNQLNTVYAKYRYLKEGETPCVSDSITHDNIPPEIDFTNPPGPWTTANLTISMTANDSGSGVKEIQCDKQDHGQFETCGLNVAYNSMINNQDYALVVRAKDKAGNFSKPKQTHWKVDGIPPTFTLENGPTMVPFGQTTYARFLNISDGNGSGVRDYQCSINGTVFPCTEGQTYTLNANNLQKDNFQVTVFDNVGNPATKTFEWQAQVVSKRMDHEVKGSPKVDILFIVDTSVSMDEERKELAKKIDGFTSHLGDLDLDWQIAATTTTVVPDTYGPNISPGKRIWSYDRRVYDRCLFDQNNGLSRGEILSYGDWSNTVNYPNSLPVYTMTSMYKIELISSRIVSDCTNLFLNNPYKYDHAEHSEGRLTDFTGHGTHILNSSTQNVQQLFGDRIPGISQW